MKILVDEMSDGWDEKLSIAEYEAYSVKKLLSQGKDLKDDPSVIRYARDNDMLLVTKDVKCGSLCKAAGIKYILIDDDEIFQRLLYLIKKSITNT